MTSGTIIDQRLLRLRRKTILELEPDYLWDANYGIGVADGAKVPARTIYCHDVFSNDTTAIAAGATQYQNLTSYYWFTYDDPTYDYSAVVPSIVSAGIAYDETLGLGGIRLIDIEEWDPYTEASLGMPNWIIAASMWQEATTYPMGFYRLFPDSISSYTYPVSFKTAVAAGNAVTEARWRSIISSWMRANDRNMAQIGDHVDFLTPYVNVSYNGSQTDWQWSAGLQILEATRLAGGKPVYPLLWFKARFEDPMVDLTEAEYISALQFVAAFPGVSGIIAYSEAPAPETYTWTDVIADLIAGTEGGDFEDV